MSATATVPNPLGTPEKPIPRLVAAGIGVLAVLAALGAAQLVAGLVSPGSSPFFAVGDTIIRYSPEGLTEFGKGLGRVYDGGPFWDKLLLQTGIAVVLAAAGAAAGLLSRRTHRIGVRVLVAIGLLGAAAVFLAPTFAPLDLLAPAAALGAGVGTFRWLHGLACRALDDPSTPDERTGLRRRDVLVGAAAGVGVVSVGAGLGGLSIGRGVTSSRDEVTAMLQTASIERAPAVPAGADFAGSGTPTFLTSNAEFYRIDVALRVPAGSAADWRLRVHGMVDRELSIGFADLMARPLVERDITMTCVSNPVGGDLISTARFVGVDLRDLLMEAGVQQGADQIFSRSVDGWYTGTPTSVLLEPDRGALLAVGMNGEALPPEHGFPVRMVVPGLYGYVSATKWVVDIEATTFEAEQAYWRERGWSERGPIKTECRIDSPQGFGSVPAGQVTVVGIAWAQHTGIGKVEVRMDGGAWQEAELSTSVSKDTWRMWRTQFQLGAGSHTVQARATDALGNVQTEQRADPVPDGATGWPATIFSVG